VSEDTARIQTVSSVPCPHGNHADNPYATRRGSYRDEDAVCLRTKGGDWWQITELHPPVVCAPAIAHAHRDDTPHHGADGTWLDWYDGAPGAVPHTKPEAEPEAEAGGEDRDILLLILKLAVRIDELETAGGVRDEIEEARARYDEESTP
jgi:hypothetical protein